MLSTMCSIVEKKPFQKSFPHRGRQFSRVWPKIPRFRRFSQKKAKTGENMVLLDFLRSRSHWPEYFNSLSFFQAKEHIIDFIHGWCWISFMTRNNTVDEQQVAHWRQFLQPKASVPSECTEGSDGRYDSGITNFRWFPVQSNRNFVKISSYHGERVAEKVSKTPKGPGYRG